MSLHPHPDPMLEGTVNIDDAELGDEAVLYAIGDVWFTDLADETIDDVTSLTIRRIRVLIVADDTVTAPVTDGRIGPIDPPDATPRRPTPDETASLLMKQLEKSVAEAKARRAGGFRP